MIDHCWNLLFSKAKEYASDEDRLANFKQPTTLFGVSAPEICLYYDSKHIASMVMIAQDISKGKLPTRELLKEKVGDYLNYGLLFYSTVLELIEKEEQEEIEAQSSEITEPLVKLVLENCEELTFKAEDVSIEYSFSVANNRFEWVELRINKMASLHGAKLWAGDSADWQKRLKCRDIVSIIEIDNNEEGIRRRHKILVPWEDKDESGEENKLETIDQNGIDMVYSFGVAKE